MRRRHKYQQGRSVKDQETMSLDLNVKLSAVDDSSILQKYKGTYRYWISSTKNNNISGLDLFPYSTFSNGTTEAFDKFFIRHSKRTFRVFKGEYAYHKIMFKSGLDFAFIEDAPLSKHDAVIVSLPFSNTGSNYQYEQLMHECTQLDIPVLVDCCWFGTCGELDIDLNYPCIREVTFSLSKTFPVARFRIGIRFTKENYDEDGLFVYEQDNYINYHAMHIGVEYMNRFSPDFIFNKYREKQLKICEALEVIPGNVVSLAYSTEERWSHLSRGMPGLYRLCISDDLEK